MTSRRVALWLGSLIGGAALIGLSIYLVRIGLDRSDKVGSVLGAFSGLVGVGLSVFGLVLARGASASGRRETSAAEPAPAQIRRTGRIKQSNSGGVNVAITGVAEDIAPPSDRR